MLETKSVGGASCGGKVGRVFSIWMDQYLKLLSKSIFVSLVARQG
jgi:hypothetical protein